MRNLNSIEECFLPFQAMLAQKFSRVFATVFGDKSIGVALRDPADFSVAIEIALCSGTVLVLNPQLLKVLLDCQIFVCGRTVVNLMGVIHSRGSRSTFLQLAFRVVESFDSLDIKRLAGGDKLPVANCNSHRRRFVQYP